MSWRVLEVECKWMFIFSTSDRNFVECGEQDQVVVADGETIEEALADARKDLPSTGDWELVTVWVQTELPRKL